MTDKLDKLDIKEEVRGQEAEVLAALGIANMGRNKHINCPYPGHPDKHPSWRWDTDKVRAFCTCLGDKSDGVFDVVMKCRGLEFPGAMAWVAEILGVESRGIRIYPVDR